MTPWLVVPRPNPRASQHLVMFPYAGAGASSFFSWVPGLTEEAEVAIVQLPGRETRVDEPLLRDLKMAALGVAGAVRGLGDRPMSFFGHSLGALLAYEVCRVLLQSSARVPELLILSGRSPPHLPARRTRTSTLPRDELFSRMAELGGMPEATLASRELLDYFEPILRADLEMNDRFVTGPPSKLPIPMVAFAGQYDLDFPPEDIARWSEASVSCSLHCLDGGHFFINPHREAIVKLIRHYLGTVARAA